MKSGITALKNNNGITFKKWLAKKGFSYDEFSQKSGIQYTTIVAWTRGAKPRKIATKLLKQGFPDCPLVRD